MALANDTFTGTDGTDLTAHALDSGHSWAAANGSLEIATNRARPKSNASAVNGVYRASAVPPSADYSVFGTVSRQVSNNSRMGPAGRMATGDLSCYTVIYSNNAANFQLLRISTVGGVAATLGTFADTIAVGGSRAVELRMAGTSIKVLIDGVEQISVTDANITAAGRAGLFGTNPALAAGGIHIDDWSTVNSIDTVAAELATETDTAQAITWSKAKAAELASETDSALDMTVVQSGGTVEVPTDLASETDTAQAVVPLRTRSVELTTETEAAQGLTSLKTLAVGLPSETDTAFDIDVVQVGVIEEDTELAEETDSAQTLTAAKSREIGLFIDRALATHLDVDGHSITAGTGATNSTTRFSRQVANALGLTESNQAIGGSAAHLPGAANDGWGKVYTDDPRTGLTAPYSRLTRMALLMYGINDAAWLGPLDFQAPFRHAMRAIISRHRSGAVFENSDSTVTLSAGWTNVALTASWQSGSDVARATTSGRTVTIAVPAGFAGGTIALGFLGYPTHGAQHTITVDGAAHSTFDTRNQGATNTLSMVHRLTGLAAGAHTIVITGSDLTNFDWFDYWAIEATPAEPVVLVKQYTCLDYTTFTTAGFTFAPTDTDVSVLNSILEELADEFDNVLVVDTEPAMAQDPAKFGADGVHPNQLGHDAIAAAIIDALVQPDETDSAQALTSSKSKAVELAAETETAQAISARRVYPLDLASETDTASGVTSAKAPDLGAAEESEVAHAVASAKALVLDLATESDAAQAVSRVVFIPVEQAVEDNQAFALGLGLIRLVQQAVEEDVARGIRLLFFSYDGPPEDFTYSGDEDFTYDGPPSEFSYAEG